MARLASSLFPTIAAMNSSAILLNPYTPMAFLSRADGEGHMIAAYVYTATTAVRISVLFDIFSPADREVF